MSWSQRDIGTFDEDVRAPGRQLIEALLDVMVVETGVVLLSHSSLLEQQQPSVAKHHAHGVDPKRRATLRCRVGPCCGYGPTVDFSLTTDRLRLRHWRVDDAEAALATYGVADVTGWLTPSTDRIGDPRAMRSVLQAWEEVQPNLLPPRGRWAIERLTDGAAVGGLAIRLLPPDQKDLEISFQLRPEEWGKGYATEAAGALIRWAFAHDAEELFAVTLPHNTRAIATIERLGMEWVGETTKYYDRTLQVYRIRPSDVSDA